MSVPRITIPESAFDPAVYHLSGRLRARTLLYVLRLTRGSVFGAVVAYLVGLLLLRPLMAATTLQRLDFLETCRARLRDLYLGAVSRVRVIPVIGFTRGDGEKRRVYVDAMCQTDDANKDADMLTDTLGLGAVAERLAQLCSTLSRVGAYLAQNVPHYNIVNFALRDLRQKADLVLFNQQEPFTAPPEVPRRTANVAMDVTTSVRSIKGMFMSGKV